MADLVLTALFMVFVMSSLVASIVLYTVALKLTHPKWSWRKCAKKSTLIQ